MVVSNRSLKIGPISRWNVTWFTAQFGSVKMKNATNVPENPYGF